MKKILEEAVDKMQRIIEGATIESLTKELETLKLEVKDLQKKVRTQSTKWYRVEDVSASNSVLKKQMEQLQEMLIGHKLSIYSADKDVTIGIHNPKWHRIVCNYEGNVCIGSPRPHWRSSWSIQENGFHLEAMHDEKWVGWFGQYKEDNKMKYDELPRDILMLHHNTLLSYMKDKFGVWYPCHLYDDYNGVMYRP